MSRKNLAAATLVIVTGLTLTACGGGNDSSGMSGMSGMGSSAASPGSSTDAMGDFNDADVTFATEMIPHHRQAVEMAKLAATRAESQQVKDLATQIVSAQGPEIQTMSGWLTSWGKPLPSEMSGMDMSSSMPGMMSSADMDKLKKATGPEFDRMFLTMMIEHHQGAIAMAQTEQADGKYAAAVALAKQIESAQTKELTTMTGLMG